MTVETQNKRVLIIDDDNWMQRVVSLFLNNLGYEPIVRTKPIDGIIEAVNNPPDLIILDYLLPEITGDVIYRMLKNFKYTSKIPVIFMSANFDIETLKKFTSIGGTYFLSKPFNKTKLEEKINLALDIKPKPEFVTEGEVYLV